MPNRFRLDASSFDELNARVLAEYGPTARILSVNTVTTGGVQGFFARRRYEAEIEVPDAGPMDSMGAIGAHDFGQPARAGIAALLDGADLLDGPDLRDGASLRDGAEPRDAAGGQVTVDVVQLSSRRSGANDGMPRLSTTSVDFDVLMAELSYQTAQVVPVVEAPTSTHRLPAMAPGDLVVVIGLLDDPIRIAGALAAGSDSRSILEVGENRTFGVHRPEGRITDRRSALAARAAGVRQGESVFAALSLPRTGLDDDSVFALHYLEPDQVWAVVDAGRKPADTARWIANVRAAVAIDALAVVGSDATSTPKTVNDLGLPVGWVEHQSIG